MNRETVEKGIIETEALKKIYKNGREKLIVLHDINLRVKEPAVISITGESGCGKSTFLNIIGGLDNPSGGRVYVFGKRIDNLPEDEMTDFRKKTVFY